MRWLLFLLVAAFPASAQDLQGNDTAGNWRVTHHDAFGIWTSICDEREERGNLVQRCYLRHVDVFSPKPDFAAQFVFITPENGGYKIAFGMEPGTFFPPDGFRIQAAQGDIWHTRYPGCLTGLSCTFTGSGAQRLVDAMVAGETFRFTFRDRHGRWQDLGWSLQGFDTALADFHAQSRRRGLIGPPGRDGG